MSSHTNRTIACPVCGRKFGVAELRSGTYRCGGCNQVLRLQRLRRNEEIGALLLGFLIAYLSGAHDLDLLIVGVLLSFLVVCGLAFVRGAFFPKAETAAEGPPHIIFPRD